MTFNRKAPYLLLFPFLAIAVHSSAQESIQLGKEYKVREVEILPASFTIDNTFNPKGDVKTNRISKNESSDFRAVLTALSTESAKEGGNVIRLTRIEDQKQKGHYRFWGEAYYTSNLAGLQEKIANKKKKRFSDGACAYITIYRPSYNGGFSDDSIKYDIVVNDSLTLQMQGNSRYVLRVAKEGSVKLVVKHKSFIQQMNVDVKMGNDYYVRNYVNFPGSHKYVTTGEFKVRLRGYTPYLEQVTDALQGDVESSMITQVVVSKKI